MIIIINKIEMFIYYFYLLHLVQDGKRSSGNIIENCWFV